MRKEVIKQKLNELNLRSAWSNGVREYAFMLLENLEDDYGASPALQKALLNGAQNWKEYSYGGCALIYDSEIAETLCTPSELKKTERGKRPPNTNESWLDVQARALHQAAELIVKTIKEG